MINHNPTFAGHIAFWGLISLTLFLIVPALAQPDQLHWEARTSNQTAVIFLFLVGTITTTTGLRRLYASLYKRKTDINPIDLADMPANGYNLGEILHEYIKMFTDRYYTLEELRKTTQRLTPKAQYVMAESIREALTHTLGKVLDRFEELETIHEIHIDAMEETTNRLRNLMALPDEEKLDDILNLTEEALILAKHCRKQFQEWYPADTDYSGDHVWLEIHTHIEYLIAQAKDMEHNWKSAESEKGPLETRIADLDFEVQEWRKATQQLSPTQSPPGSPLQPGHAKMLIANIIKQADLSPVAALLLPSARPIPLTPATLAQTIQLELNKIRDSIQSVYPQEKLEDFSNLDVFLKNATNWAKRATRYYAGMSGVQATGDQQTMTLRQIWNEIPAGMRPLGGNCPTDIDDFRTWLNSLSRPVVPNQPQGCNHPAELATELGDPIAQPWNTSLTHVRRLVNQPPTGNPPPGGPPPAPRPDPAPAVGNQEPLFRTSDIPKFGDEDDYWTYRRSMTIFCEATTVNPAQLPTAMARIIASFSGERRKTAMAFDLTEIYHATWEETWPALLQYMDNHFLDRNAWLQQYNHWIGLRYSDHKWGREFVSLYIREHATLNQIAAVQNKRAIPDAEAVQKLVDRVPRRVNEQLRHEHRDWQALANQRQIYEWIIEEWEHAKNLGLLEKAPKKDNPAPARNMNVPVNAPGNTGQPRINWPDLVCDKPCFDTNPPVHPSLRGPWRDLKPEQQRGLHSRCRRPISEHGKGIKGCPQAGQHLFHKGTNTDPAPPARQITQGNNEDQALVAPLGSSSGNE